MPAGVLGRVGPDQVEQLRPVRQVAVVAVHDLGLAEVDRLEAQVDVRGRQEVEPQLRLRPAHVGDRGVPAPLVLPPAVGVEHVGVAEIPFLDRLAQGGERPVRDRNLLDLLGHDLEDAGLQDHVRVGGVDLGDLLLRPLEVAQQVGLAAPEAEAPADELGAGGLEHADVVVEVAAAVEQPLHRDGPGQVVLQHRAGNRPVELVIAGRRGVFSSPHVGVAPAADGWGDIQSAAVMRTTERFCAADFIVDFPPARTFREGHERPTARHGLASAGHPRRTTSASHHLLGRRAMSLFALLPEAS